MASDPSLRPLALVMAAILLAAVLGFAWTRPGHRERHVQLRAIEGTGVAYEASLRRALSAAGVPLVTGGRDLAIDGRVVARGDMVRVESRFEDAREGRVVWRRVDTLHAGDPLDAVATRTARVVACGIAAFDTRKLPLPPAAIPPYFRRCEAAVTAGAR